MMLRMVPILPVAVAARALVYVLLAVLPAVVLLDAVEMDVARVVLATVAIPRGLTAAPSSEIARVAAAERPLKVQRMELSRRVRLRVAAAAVLVSHVAR